MLTFMDLANLQARLIKLLFGMISPHAHSSPKMLGLYQLVDFFHQPEEWLIKLKVISKE